MTAQSIPTELGTEKIGRLLKQYALPAIIAQTAASLYNMVDSIFIGQGVGALAISGLAITFPLMNLSTAFGTLVGAGASTLISVLLGQKKYDKANKVLGNVVSLNVIIGLLFMATALIFIDPILYFFGASENTLPFAKEYMKIILYGNIITHVYFGLNAAMRSSGSPKKAMGLTIFTVLLNTILDPIFIFAFDLGIAGAAWATVIAQFVAMIVVLHHFSNKDRAFHFERNLFRIDWKIAKDSLAIGLGPFLMHSAACLVTLFINQQLRTYSGDLGIGAYGICNRITFIFAMICLGLNQGMQPIAGYNYGARLYSRVKEVFWKTAGLATVVSTACFIISVFTPRLAAGIFTHDPQLLEMSAKGLRTMNMVFPIVGFQMIATNLFQSLGMVKKSVLLSLSRQILFLLPLLYFLPLKFGDTGVWLSYPISDLLSCALTSYLLYRLLKKFSRVKDGEIFIHYASKGRSIISKKKIIIIILTALGVIAIASASIIFHKPVPKPQSIENLNPRLNTILTNDMSEHPDLSGLDRKVESYMRKWAIKGASLAVMRNDSLLFAKGYGWADREKEVKMDAGHILRMASVSKLITATGIMVLQDKGLLSIKDTVFGPSGILHKSALDTLIRDRNHHKMTIEHLLRHQGGFYRDPVFSSRDVQMQMRLDNPPVADDYFRLMLPKRLRFMPGSWQKYSNFGYLLLSRIIEEVSGKDYESFIREDVLAPAGCYDMHIAANYYEEKRGNEVRYYTHEGDGKYIEEYNGSGKIVERCYGGNNIPVLSGAGAWCGSPAEIARFVASIDGCSGIPDIISEKSFREMIEYFDTETFSLGWNDTTPEKGWSRTGTLSGTSALVKMFPDGECWIMITNTSTWKGPGQARYTDALFKQCRELYSAKFPARNLFKVN